MSLRIGDLAPEWTLLGSHGGEVKEMSLRQLVAEHRAVVLTTYVLDFTGGWRNQVSQFGDAYGEFRREGAEVVAVSVDSPYCHRAWAEELGVEYPLVSDFDRELLEKYGALGSGSKFLPRTAKRTAFVIDSRGVVRYGWLQPESGGLPPIPEVLEAVRGLPKGWLHVQLRRPLQQWSRVFSKGSPESSLRVTAWEKSYEIGVRVKR